MLSHLPPEFPAAILVVQHMPAGFTETFARRLNDSCSLDVKEAQSGDLLAAGRVLVCPGDRHMKVRRMPLGDVVVLSDDVKMNGHRPSVDVLFRSVGQEFGADSIGLLMTGMGEDGAEGLGVMKAAGALTIAQDEASSIVFGMPRAAIERGYACRVVSLEALPATLVAHCTVLRALPVKEPYPVRTGGQL
jgi:two-component system chemotaxis response regulator CheB